MFKDNSSKQNIFPCPHCYETTRHIKVSLAEGFSIDWKTSKIVNTVGRIVGGASELLGTASVCEHVADCYYWKCVNCGTITARKANGQIRRIYDELE